MGDVLEAPIAHPYQTICEVIPPGFQISVGIIISADNKHLKSRKSL